MAGGQRGEEDTMRYPMILLGAACSSFMLLPACVPAPESDKEVAQAVEFDQPADEAAIREFLEEFMALYNNHDAQSMPSFFLDREMVLWAEEKSGGATIEQLYAEIFERNKDIRAQIVEDLGVRFLAPTVALWRGTSRFTGLHDADGELMPPLSNRAVVMMVKKGGQWKFAALFDRPVEDESST
jgi:ketosteroid isomerase-like protein